ncbi:MAG: hypothetical protein M3469_07635, partial [Actinomycetota bacterium]|nr:hypothetical protein [Actinomycetota bacterium]
VVLYLGAYSADAVLDPLWRHFHGAPRTPGPSYLDALAVLRELGIAPQVKVVEIPNRRRFATIEDAVEHYRDWLLLPDTTDVKGSSPRSWRHGCWVAGARYGHRCERNLRRSSGGGRREREFHALTTAPLVEH